MEGLDHWLATLPHLSESSRMVLVDATTHPQRGFPHPIGLLWPAEASFVPIWNPWLDAGAGVLLLELASDPGAVPDLVQRMVERLYDALVLHPAPASSLLVELLEECAAGEVAALATDLAPLTAHQDWVALYSDDSQPARHMLALHLGAWVLQQRLLPRVLPQWAEAVLHARTAGEEAVAKLPRTASRDPYQRFLSQLGRCGAMRRQHAAERVTEVLGEEEWGMHVVELPLLQVAQCGVHRAGDELWLRCGMQPAGAQCGYLAAGIGTEAVRWEWRSEAVRAAALEAERTCEPRVAQRRFLQWETLRFLRERRTPIRAGSNGLLRTRAPEAFADPMAYLDSYVSAGLIRDVRRLTPLGYVLG